MHPAGDGQAPSRDNQASNEYDELLARLQAEHPGIAELMDAYGIAEQAADVVTAFDTAASPPIRPVTSNRTSFA